MTWPVYGSGILCDDALSLLQLYDCLTAAMATALGTRTPVGTMGMRAFKVAGVE